MTQVLAIGFVSGFLYAFTALSSILTTLQFSLQNGAKAGIVGSLGCVTAQIFWVSLAIVAVSVGVDVVTATVVQYRFLAVCILLVVGLKLFFSPPCIAQRNIQKKFTTYFSAYCTVFSVAIAAPSRFVGYAALFILLGASFIANVDFQAKVALLLATLAGIVTWWGVFVSVVYKLKIEPTPKKIYILQKISAVFLLGLAILVGLAPLA